MQFKDCGNAAFRSKCLNNYAKICIECTIAEEIYLGNMWCLNLLVKFWTKKFFLWCQVKAFIIFGPLEFENIANLASKLCFQIFKALTAFKALLDLTLNNKFFG